MKKKIKNRTKQQQQQQIKNIYSGQEQQYKKIRMFSILREIQPKSDYHKAYLS